MRKGADSGQDEDSAIGESENNSASEENTNFGQSLSIFVKLCDSLMKSESLLNLKLQQQIPLCLLKNCDKEIEKSLKKCELFYKISFNEENTKSTQKTPVPAATSRNKHAEISTLVPTSYANRSNMNVLEAKLLYLFLEMKKLRRLDQTILQKLVGVNERLYEMTCKMKENQTTLNLNLQQDQTHNNIIKLLPASRWSDINVTMENKTAVIKSNVSYTSPLYVREETLTNKTFPEHSCLVRSPKEADYVNMPFHKPYAYSNPTYVDVKSWLKHGVQDKNNPLARNVIEKTQKTNNYYRFRSPNLSQVSSEVTLIKPDYDILQNLSSQRKRNKIQTKRLEKATSVSTKKFAEPEERQQNICNHPKKKENCQINEQSSWVAEAFSKKVSKLQRHHVYQKLVGISSVKKEDKPLVEQVSQREPHLQSSKSGFSFRSSDFSTTKAKHFASSLRGVSHLNQWEHFGLKKVTRKHAQLNNTLDGRSIATNNSLKANKTLFHKAIYLSRDENVATAACKHLGSTTYLLQTKDDDITYL